MTNGISNYDSWISSLQSRGLKTTNVSGQKGEANFADYANALSSSLKEEVLASFDTAADLGLQNKLAGLLSGNMMKSESIASKLKGSGISVDVAYVKTSYISDNKADGKFDKDVRGGSVAVYTFSDGNGGKIKIADTNGNGALETEEVFMNEILSGVVSDASVSSGGAGGGSEGMSAEDLAAEKVKAQQAIIDKLNAQRAEAHEKFLAQQAEIDKALEESRKAGKLNGEDEKKEKITESDYNDKVMEMIRSNIGSIGSGDSLTNIQTVISAMDSIKDKYNVNFTTKFASEYLRELEGELAEKNQKKK